MRVLTAEAFSIDKEEDRYERAFAEGGDVAEGGDGAGGGRLGGGDARKHF